MEHINPYDPNQEDFLQPFVGRDSDLLQIQQHIHDPIGVTFVARQLMGKTALLKQFSGGINPSIIGVYIPLKQISLDNDKTWMQTLIQATIDAVKMRGFELSSELTPDEDNPRDWFKDKCLPSLFRIIHSQRRIVLLLDDAEILMKASSSNDNETFTLKQDTFAYLQGLLNSQLNIILTIDLAFEYDLDLFYPLIDQNTTVNRLSLLSEKATEALIRFSNLPYTLTDVTIKSIYHATGGEPALLQQFGFHLFEYAQQENIATIDTKELKIITSTVYQKNTSLFQQLWQLLNRNERHTLTALSNLTYNDPLQSLNSSAIEAWLVQTDYPMDITSINVALRGLEYYELIHRTTDKITVATGLMQKWLLDNARLEDNGIAQANSPELASNKYMLTLAILLAILVVGVMFIAISTSSNTDPANTPVPTIPLSNGQ